MFTRPTVCTNQFKTLQAFFFSWPRTSFQIRPTLDIYLKAIKPTAGLNKSLWLSKIRALSYQNSLTVPFYTPPHYSGGVLWLHVGRPCVSPSVRPSVVRPPSVCPFFLSGWFTWVNINRFSPNLVCALILWISGLGLLMSKFRQIFTELSSWDTPIFLFLDDNLSK